MAVPNVILISRAIYPIYGLPTHNALVLFLPIGKASSGLLNHAYGRLPIPVHLLFRSHRLLNYSASTQQ